MAAQSARLASLASWIFGRAATFLSPLSMFTAGDCALLFWLAKLAVGWLQSPRIPWPHGPPPFPIERLSGGLFFAFVVIGIVMAARVIRRFSVPVGAWLDAADRVERGDYRAKVPARGPRELRLLAPAASDTQVLNSYDHTDQGEFRDLSHRSLQRSPSVKISTLLVLRRGPANSVGRQGHFRSSWLVARTSESGIFSRRKRTEKL